MTGTPPAQSSALDGLGASGSPAASGAPRTSGRAGAPGRARSRGRLAGWLALVVVLAGALLFGVVDDSGPRSAGDRARDLAESIACPQCDGQSVADSDSSASRAIRERIDERIAAGVSDAQIRDELAQSFGEDLLLEPGRSGVSSLVWTLPVVALVAALAALAFAFRRWRGGGAAHASDADRALVDQARAKVSVATETEAGDR